MTSAQPAVVFSSLAALSVAGFADACQVVITEGAECTYRIQRPLAHVPAPLRTLIEEPPPLNRLVAQTVSAYTVCTPLLGDSAAGEPGYTGIVVHYWLSTYRPTARDATSALLAVDLAVAAVAAERAAAAGRVPEDPAALSIHQEVSHVPAVTFAAVR